MSRIVNLCVSGGVLVVLAFVASAAVPDRPAPPEERAQVQIVIKVPAKVEQFLNTRLEVAIYEYHPQVGGQETLVAKHIDNKFSHKPPNETNKAITLVLNAPVRPQKIGRAHV